MFWLLHEVVGERSGAGRLLGNWRGWDALAASRGDDRRERIMEHPEISKLHGSENFPILNVGVSWRGKVE